MIRRRVLLRMTHAVSLLKCFTGLVARPINQICKVLEADDSITTYFRHPASDARLFGYPHLHRSWY